VCPKIFTNIVPSAKNFPPDFSFIKSMKDLTAGKIRNQKFEGAEWRMARVRVDYLRNRTIRATRASLSDF
jgi:hypothetical protein